MCNAWNHPPGCNCGWGGEGSLGSTGGWANSHKYPKFVPIPEKQGGLTSYKCKSNDFCRPTTCQYCGSKVYFIRHNGGTVWLDELGWPWPKHECFDSSNGNEGYGAVFELADRSKKLEVKPRLANVVKRIYLDGFVVYLLASDQGRLSTLAVWDNERTVLFGLVTLHQIDEALFLADRRQTLIRMINLELAEETIQQCLCCPDDIVRVTNEQMRAETICEHCRCTMPLKSLRRHLRKVHKIST